MTPPNVNPNFLPSQFRENAKDSCAREQHTRSLQQVVSLEQSVRHLQIALQEVGYALKAARGNGPQREEEKLIAAEVNSMAPLAGKAKAMVVTLRKQVEAEQTTEKAALARSVANSHGQPRPAIKVQSERQLAFDQAVAGKVQEKRPEVEQPRQSEFQASFEKAANGNERGKIVRPAGLNSQQVEHTQPQPVPRPSPAWAAEADAKVHSQAMRADDVRAADRNAYLDAIAAGLAERRGMSSGFNRGAERNQQTDVGREAGR